MTTILWYLSIINKKQAELIIMNVNNQNIKKWKNAKNAQNFENILAFYKIRKKSPLIYIFSLFIHTACD